MRLSRRDLLRLGVASSAVGAAGPLGALGCAGDAPGDGWDRGDLQHLLPTASHRAFNLKASFRRPLEAAPRLAVGERSVPGERQDTDGRFWAFRLGGLDPDTEYALELRDATGAPLCESWTLATLPAPDARPAHVRVVSFTCAGGMNVPIPPSLFHAFKPAAWRRALFDAMLAHRPQLVIANGDHVYYDLPAMSRIQQHWAGGLLGRVVRGLSAAFDPGAPVLGSPNEAALTAVGDDQIASTYGVRFRSTPVFFVTDDHDYFDNDDATPERVSFPPDAFHRALRDALQRLYFPEFLVEAPLGTGVPGQLEGGGVRLSSTFGEVRWGDLLQGLFYDCGGHLGLGEGAGLVPPAVERWLVHRTQREDTLHLVHCPSHPMGWTAGKWREWYPDLLESTGSIVAPVTADAQGGKYLWQEGWWRQHQRLVAALSGQRRRRALSVSGDLHALGALRIERSGDLHLGANPVTTVLSGPVGTGEVGWPSRARGVETRVPKALSVDVLQGLDERNGFTVLDFDRSVARVEVFGCGPEFVAPDALRPESTARFEIG